MFPTTALILPRTDREAVQRADLRHARAEAGRPTWLRALADRFVSRDRPVVSRATSTRCCCA